MVVNQLVQQKLGWYIVRGCGRACVLVSVCAGSDWCGQPGSAGSAAIQRVEGKLLAYNATHRRCQARVLCVLVRTAAGAARAPRDIHFRIRRDDRHHLPVFVMVHIGGAVVRM